MGATFGDVRVYIGRAIKMVGALVLMNKEI